MQTTHKKTNKPLQEPIMSNANTNNAPTPARNPGCGWQSARKRRGGKNKNCGHNKSRQQPTNTFMGGIPKMNGHVFQCHGETKEKSQFSRTIDKLQIYIGVHMKHGAADLKKMVCTMVNSTFTQPTNISGSAMKTQTAIWQAEVDLFVKRKEAYCENKNTMYSVIWSQCSKAMQAKIKATNNYEDILDNNDSLWLLEAIKGIAYKFESQKSIYVALDNAKGQFYSARQGQNKTSLAYLTRFKDMTAVIKHYGGTVGVDQAFMLKELRQVNITKAKASDAKKRNIWPLLRKKHMPLAFLRCADNNRYALLTTDLENQFTCGNDQYPKNITDAYYSVLVNYRRPNSEKDKPKGANTITAQTNMKSITTQGAT